MSIFKKTDKSQRGLRGFFHKFALQPAFDGPTVTPSVIGGRKLPNMPGTIPDGGKREMPTIPGTIPDSGKRDVPSIPGTIPDEASKRGGGKLSDLKPGESGVVAGLRGNAQGRLRLMEMGITPGAQVKVVHAAAFGGPLQITIRGYQLSLRREEASGVLLG